MKLDFNLTIKDKKITFLSDDNYNLFAVLVNGIFEKQFNTDFLNKFDDGFDIKLVEEFIENYEFFNS